MGLAARPTTATRPDLLRRLDWRFLLPFGNTMHVADAVFLGCDPALPAAASEIGFAARPKRELPAADSTIDLVAVLGGSAVDARRVAAALRPAGVVYWEVDRRRARRLTPQRLQRMLADAGLEPLGAYAVRPRLEAAELYLPLDALGPARWFIDSVYTPGRPAQHILEWVGRILLKRPAAFAAAAPYFVVVAQKPPVGGTSMPTKIADRAGAPAENRAAMLNHSGARVVFALCDGRGRATLVAKVPKTPALVERTAREHEMLECLHQSVDAALVEGAPKPLGADVVGGAYATWQSAQAGSSMARRDGAWGARTGSRISDLDAAAAWMTRLHRVHRFGVRAWDGRAADDVVCRSIDAYSRQFGVTDSERFLFRRVMERAVEFRGDLPVVWEHGDYTVWNLFRRAGTSSDPADSVGVLDWEGAGPGLPYVDLFRFAVHWTELASNDARRLGRRAMLARTLFGDATQVGSAARGALDRYLAAVGVDPSLEPVLITRLYVELAVRRHEIAVEGGVMPDHPRASNPAIDMVGHLASFADRW